jgi:hypothetical protein
MSALSTAQSAGLVVLAVLITAALLPAGMAFGAGVARALAAWQDRDIGELKGLYIWSSLAFGPVLSLAGLWAALVLTRGHSYAIRLVRNLFGGAVFVALFLCVASYEPIKTSGWPVIAYELRLPRAIEVPDRSGIDVTVWSETGGKGCAVDRIASIDDRLVVSGDCVITNDNPTMSLLIRPNAEGHWKLPVPARPAIERSWGTWTPLALLPAPRHGTLPLPEGEYGIRYRVRGFI